MTKKKSPIEQIKESTTKLFLETPNDAPREYLPDMMRAMEDINNNTRSIEDINWEKEFRHAQQFLYTTRSNVPYPVWLWGMLTLVKSLETRIEILHKLRDCFSIADGKDGGITFMSNCDSLIEINHLIEKFNKGNHMRVVRWWSGKEQFLGDLAHIFSDGEITGDSLVAIANSTIESYDDAAEYKVLTLVLRAFDKRKPLLFESIVDFCDGLDDANTYRSLLVQGFTDFDDKAKDAEPIPWQLRNKCFDIYIQKRLKEIEKELNASNKRLKAADELECYQSLYEKEKWNVAQAGYTEYDENDMPVIFLNYVKMIIDEKNSKEPSRPTMIFQGPVGQVIGNVEQLNINKDER